ncbi:MAG: tRNA modification GTPase [Planctomycetaceae bacterium]|nr:tRNA modification GTPase [Planctomycetaceae bacterium]
MTWRLDDVIVALGSAPGSSLRGIIRASGAHMLSLFDKGFQPDDAEAWRSVRVPQRHPGHLTLPGLSSPLRVSVHCWPTSRSYTGQPLIEVHLPGSSPVLEGVLAELCRRGARVAKPGEFTLRAFLAGKLDLIQAEAVLGVIDADDDAGLRTALEQLAGGVSHRLAELRHDLLNLLADLEAGLDFVEEHLEFVARGELHARLSTARLFVEQLAQTTTGRMHHAGHPRVVLAGLPNAGKSTLFNALVGTSAALVSAQAGTTRDFLEATVTWNGHTFDLVDTAGWETVEQDIAAEAQRLRADQLTRASLLVWCTAADATAAERLIDEERRQSCPASKLLGIVTKADRVTDSNDGDATGLAVSAQTGAGLQQLREMIVAHWQRISRTESAWLGTTAARCQESVQATLVALTQAEQAAADPYVGEELIAVELRDALDHLGRIVGAVYTDDLLDRIFSRFCIGK